MTMFTEAATRVDQGADPKTEAEAIVSAMTTDEKLWCLDGDMPFWPGLTAMTTEGYGSRTWPAAVVERLGVPGIEFTDGPRGCVVGEATTFPVSMARGASFDADLERRIGEAIGAELRSIGATYTGAVCMNLLRHPAWGRAQETYGEDPHHVGELAVAFTEGLQRYVMACMKHFALNSMENARFSVDVTADERALHEVYLPHFKKVADAGVASVMSSYNSLNGEWCGDSPTLLTSILRDDWGWNGFVITDFLVGMRDPIGSVKAGCNIEMPFAQQRALVLVEALDDGRLDLADVENRVVETVATLLRFRSVFPDSVDVGVLGCDDHRSLARDAAVESMVLLSNDGLLPLDPAQLSKVAVLGPLANTATLGDGGSSNVVNTLNPVSPLEGLVAGLPKVDVVHSDNDLSVLDGADVAIVVVGFTKMDEGEYLGDSMGAALSPLMPPMDHPTLGVVRSPVGPEVAVEEVAADVSDTEASATEASGIEAGGAAFTEPDSGDGYVHFDGGDRDSLKLRPEDETLIAEVCARHKKVIVVAIAGSTVVMPWLDQPSASIMLWYAGSEAGNALADVLFGAEPGGRLPFATPVDEGDLVSFDKDATKATYGLLHGQWWLDANKVEAHLPFGHGLSYAEFEMGAASLDESGALVDITNTSSRSGSTVVFLYGSVPGSAFERPAQRLVGFAKVAIGAGETVKVAVSADTSVLDIRQDGAWLTEDLPIVYSIGFNAQNLTQVS